MTILSQVITTYPKFDSNQNGGGFRASESLFDKKYRHKLTWKSLDDTLKNVKSNVIVLFSTLFDPNNKG